MSDKAIFVHQYGDASVLTWQEFPLADPQSREVCIKQEAIGINFIDIYQRNGLYPLDLPFIPGSEGAGTVVACGSDVTRFKVGDRVAYGNAIGGYATSRNIHEDKLLLLPDSIPTEKAGALMLRGMTAEYLLCRTYPIKAGETVLWHAAAGGLARIAIPWLKHLGATVIGTVGSDKKRETALSFGCDHVLLSDDAFSSLVRKICPEGVPVVYDSIGMTTFEESLRCLRPRGLMVSFGNASGPVTNFDVLSLTTHGSLFLTRPSLLAYTATRSDLELSASALFAFLSKNPEVMEIQQRFSLRDATTAQKALENRQTTGLSLLIP